MELCTVPDCGTEATVMIVAEDGRAVPRTVRCEKHAERVRCFLEEQVGISLVCVEMLPA